MFFIKTEIFFNPLMPGGNKNVTLSAAGLFKYV